jgi:hypothetical protein
MNKTSSHFWALRVKFTNLNNEIQKFVIVLKRISVMTKKSEQIDEYKKKNIEFIQYALPIVASALLKGVFLVQSSFKKSQEKYRINMQSLQSILIREGVQSKEFKDYIHDLFVDNSNQIVKYPNTRTACFRGGCWEMNMFDVNHMCDGAEVQNPDSYKDKTFVYHCIVPKIYKIGKDEKNEFMTHLVKTENKIAATLDAPDEKKMKSEQKRMIKEVENLFPWIGEFVCLFDIKEMLVLSKHNSCYLSLTDYPFRGLDDFIDTRCRFARFDHATKQFYLLTQENHIAQ